MTKELLAKYENLKTYFRNLGSVAVAFSSGVDSTFLLFVANQVLQDKAIAVTATADFFPKRETDEAENYCHSLGVRHFLVEVKQDEIEGFAQNPPDRCYLCKHHLFENLIAVAKKEGIINVVEGSNLDDMGDYRPGLKAIAELGIKSPLREVGFTKLEIRQLSEYLNIPTANKPSFACLASRFPYGEEITKKKLEMVDAAEQLLLDLGFKQFRVRIHGRVARLELLPEDFPVMMQEETRLTVYERLKEYGFEYVALDLKGYRTGSMNEFLEAKNV